MKLLEKLIFFDLVSFFLRTCCFMYGDNDRSMIRMSVYDSNVGLRLGPSIHCGHHKFVKIPLT